MLMATLERILMLPLLKKMDKKLATSKAQMGMK